MDFRKAFDSIEQKVIESALMNCRIDYRYTDLLLNIYNEANTTVKNLWRIRTNKYKEGIRKEDTISLKLFNRAVEEAFNWINWDNRHINIYEEYIINLRSADGIVQLAHNKTEIVEMIQQLLDI